MSRNLIIASYVRLRIGQIANFSWKDKYVYNQPAMILKESTKEEFLKQHGVKAKDVDSDHVYFYEATTD